MPEIKETEKELSTEEKKALKQREKERKKEIKKKKDEEYKANEIKFGLRMKMIILFALIIFSIALGITFIATERQTESLLEEKNKQGNIIVRGLTASIKTRLFDAYALNADLIASFTRKDQYLEFYRQQGIYQQIFEDIDEVKKQPDVIYAYILDKNGLVLGHTNPQIQPYSEFTFDAGIKSYFESYKKQQLKELKPILKRINHTEKIKSEQTNEKSSRVIEAIDFASTMAFKTNPTIEETIGEVHIGISLESVNKQIVDTRADLQLAGLIAIIFGIIGAVVFATLIASPIRKMIEGMRKVSEGDFTASVVLHSKDEVGLLSKTFNVMLKGMSVLVSPEVAQVVLSGTDLQSSGQKRDVTVLFSDIRSFTTISESLTPHEVVLMLNEYLEIMTDIIIKHGGVVDKFVGDEIFAVFGAPFEHPNHPLAAVATALEMGVELAAHNDERHQQGKPPIRIGIGVNSGEVIAGAMGSTKRIDYTSIGDTVNLGARLEGTNKVYGTLTIISEFTYALVKDDVIVRELDLIRVKGKNEPVTIYEAMALTDSGEHKVNEFINARGTKT